MPQVITVQLLMLVILRRLRDVKHARLVKLPLPVGLVPTVQLIRIPMLVMHPARHVLPAQLLTVQDLVYALPPHLLWRQPRSIL
mgnify:CR=1 FL=1